MVVLSISGLRRNCGRLSDNSQKKKFKWWVGGYGLLLCALCIRLKQAQPRCTPTRFIGDCIALLSGYQPCGQLKVK